MRNAIIYARYSSERQTEQSIEGQLRVCNEYAERNGLNIVDTYIDRAMTGTNDQRPAFQQMLSDCAKTTAWDVVLVYAIDRFGRNSIEIAVNKQKLHKNHKTLISATQRTSENIDGTKNLDGILLENVYIGLAEYYSAELSQKVRRGMAESRRKGQFTGGHIMYGYKVVHKKIVIDEDRANVVRFIFEQYDAGVYVKDIIAKLTERGVLNRGKPFALNTVHRILRTEKYIGVYRHDGEVFTDIYPQIVSVELYNSVQAKIIDNAYGRRSPDTVYLLKNKVKCGLCGSTICAETGTSKNGKVKRYYKCLGRKKGKGCTKEVTRKDDLEKLVIDTTLYVLGSPEALSYLADKVLEMKTDNTQSQSTLNILEKERSEIQKSISNLIAALEQGIFTTSTKARLEELKARLSDIECKIVIEQSKQAAVLTKDKIIKFITSALNRSPQTMVNILIDKILLYDDRVEIYYNYTDTENPDDNKDRRDFLFCSKTAALPFSRADNSGVELRDVLVEMLVRA